MNEDRECFRRCFGTNDGRRVLGMILMDLGYFDEDKTEKQAVLTNYAKRLLQRMGFTDKPEKVRQLVDKLFEISQE